MTEEDANSWTNLFERASMYGATREAVLETLDRHRGHE